jgi:hypothetical protein
MPRPCNPSPLIRALKITSHGPLTVPLFLVPRPSHLRPFSASALRPAKLPKMPVAVPPDVTLTLLHPRPPLPDDPAALEPRDPSLRIEGPLGTFSLPPPTVLARSKLT